MADNSDSAAAPTARAAPTVADSAPLAPYRNAHEHLVDLLECLDWFLRREVARSRKQNTSDLLGFAAITDNEVNRLLTDTEPEEAVAEFNRFGKIIGDLRQRVEQRVEQTLLAGWRPPIAELARRFGLSAFEIDVVVACLAAEVDRRYERIYGYLHDDLTRKLPSPGLLLALHGRWRQQPDAHAVFGPLAPLRYFRIVEVADDVGPLPWLSRSLRIDERIAGYLLGDSVVDARIAALVTPLDSTSEPRCLTQRQRADLERLIRQTADWFGASAVRRKPVTYLHGPRNAGAATMVCEAAREFGLPVRAIDAESLCESGYDFDKTLFLFFREGLLEPAALFVQNIDRALDQDPAGLRCRALMRHIAEMGNLVFLSGEQPWHWTLAPETVWLRSLELRPGGFLEQLDTWRALTGTDVSDADLHDLISRYPLAPDAIVAAWRSARTQADAAGAQQPVTIAQIEEACRAQAHVPISGLVRRVEPKHGWCDIVLPALQLEQLRALCSQAKHLSTVYGAWGFERKLSLGKGLNALFSGPPGTGKTMAAEVVAADLRVELLKIDLSQIVSKYIGETEKNLRRLFDQATATHAILFFDEADALLGKRSEVKDAHDRYANTEIAYLLQKMEEYEGITILATNLRQNMDEAFTRRMRFIVEFPFPEEDDRLRIWKGVWPEEVPLAPDVDFTWLARRFRLSGGNIRNVALTAAFLAAEQRQSVATRHLIHAVKGELQKMGRLVNEEEYRQHA